MIDSILHDVRYAIRRLASSPGFAFVAITSLALGIGANSTIFSLVRATMFPSLPYRDASRLVDLHETTAELCTGCGVGASFAAYGEWKAQARAFVSMGASREDEFVISGTDEAVRVPGALVSFDLFSTLGVQPVLGRSFSADEDRPGGNRVIVLSYGLWQRQFGSDTGVVGRSVRVNGASATIIGVMPKRFGYPEIAQMWAPMGAALTASARDDRSIGVVARLAPGVTVERARSDIAAVGARPSRPLIGHRLPRVLSPGAIQNPRA